MMATRSPERIEVLRAGKTNCDLGDFAKLPVRLVRQRTSSHKVSRGFAAALCGGRAASLQCTRCHQLTNSTRSCANSMPNLIGRCLLVDLILPRQRMWRYRRASPRFTVNARRSKNNSTNWKGKLVTEIERIL